MIGIRSLLGILLVLSMAQPIHGQDIPRSKASPKISPYSLRSILGTAMPRLPDLDRIDVRHVKLIPSVKFGYQRMGMSLSVPIPFELSVSGENPYSGDSADLKLPDVNLWIGEVGLDARFNPMLRFYVHGAGNVIQNLFTSFTGGNGATATLWKNHPLEWMEVEAGAVYYPWEHFAVILGMRWDHFDLTIKDPTALTRIHVGQYRNLGLLTSDVLTGFWLPYVGCEARTKSLRASLIGTPFASAEVKVRTRLRADIQPSYNFLGESVMTMKSSAMFIEANVEYTMRLAEKTRLSFWGKGGWIGSQGGGRLESGYSTTHSGLSVGVSDDRNVIFGRYNLAGGMALNVTF